MAENSDKVVFLAFENPDAPEAELDMLACVRCRNKTYTIRVHEEDFPELYCAACGQVIGKMGWAD